MRPVKLTHHAADRFSGVERVEIPSLHVFNKCDLARAALCDDRGDAFTLEILEGLKSALTGCEYVCVLIVIGADNGDGIEEAVLLYALGELRDTFVCEASIVYCARLRGIVPNCSDVEVEELRKICRQFHLLT